MAICSHLAPNGEKSLLYNKLEQVYGPEKAHDYWTLVRGQQFLNKFGDWLTSPGTEVDANGELTYEYVKDKLGLQEPTTSQQQQQERVSFEPIGGRPRTATTRESEEAMDKRVRDLYATAIAHPNIIYNVDYQYLGDRRPYLSGYTARELANLFDKYNIPSNVRFDPSFQRLIENSTRRIKEQYSSDLPVEFINKDKEAVNEQIFKILTPKLSENGQLRGYFTPIQQQEITDTLIYITKSLMDRDPDMKANALIKAFYLLQQKALQLDSTGSQPELRDNLLYVYRQRVRFAEVAMRQMEGLGLRVSDSNRAKILRAVDNMVPLGEIEKKQLEEANIQVTAEQQDIETGDFEEISSRGLKDWSDVSFELDPKDTASTRIKMFIASLPEMDKGVYRAGTVEAADVVISPGTVSVGETTLSALISKVGHIEAFNQWKAKSTADFQRTVIQTNRKTVWMKDEPTTTAFVNYLNLNYPLVARENFLGMRKLVDYDATFQDVLETLADTPQDLSGYINILNSSGKPNLQYLAQELSKADPSLQNEFAKVMSKQYQQFTMVLFNRTQNPDDGDSFSLYPINANRYNQRNTIVKNWRELQKLSDIMIINETGERVMDVERIRNRWIPMLEMFAKISDWDTANIQRAKTGIGNILRVSGIDMTDQMLEYLFRNMEKITRGTSVSGGIGRQFSITKDGKPNGMFSAFILKAAGMSETNEDLSTEEAIKRSELYNPLYTENTTMQILAGVYSRYTPALHSSNHKSSEGKNVWDFGLNTKLSHKIRNFLENFDNVYSQYQEVDITRGNWLLTTIKDNPIHLENIKLSYLDGMRPTWGKRGTTRPAMSDREQLLTAISLFQNQGRGFNRSSRVHYLSLTHSDKTTTPVFLNMPRLNTGRADLISKNIIGSIDSAFYSIFKAEHARIINQKGIDYNDAKYNKGKNLFYFLPAFNYDAMRDMVQREEITEKEFRLIWINGERELTPIVTDDKELPVINKIFTITATNLIQNTIDTWKRNGIINDEKLSTTFDKQYLKKLTYENGLGENTPTEEYYQTIVNAAAKDFALNYFLFNTAMSQLFYGDPAQTFKGKAGQHDLANVDATMKEYAKRLAKDIAPGQDPYWEHTSTKYNTITLADVKPAESYISRFSETLGKAYGEVEGTDAQEVTTVQEHLDVAYAMGLMSSKIYNEMSQIIKDAGSGGYYEFTIPEHLAVIMQPMKPVYSGTRGIDRGTMLEDYVKSSSYPLYPPLTAGTEMDGLRRAMEHNNIQRANFESAKKIGSPNQPARMFTKDGKFQMPTQQEFQLAQQQLDRSGFRIQQEVPYDEEKEAIKTISQMNKLIVGGIEDISEFSVPGKGSMGGRQLREYKEQIRSAMITLQAKDFLSRFGIDREALESGQWTINDKGKIYNLLAEEAQKKGYTINELQSLLIRDNNGELAIPLIFNSAADKLESMLVSLVKKISEVKMPGKSYVQASSVGFTFTREEGVNKSKVVWVAGYDGSPLKTLRIEDGIVKPAQILVPFNFFRSDGSRLNVMDFAREEDGRLVLDTEKVPLALLQMVGARIPNQGHNSMLPVEVVGFVPDNMGDLVVVPSAITKQMGADFDVDKLYTYKRNYTVNEDGSLSVADNGMDSIEQLQNSYFDVHWSVLTHPEMVEKVLQPLDKDDLKNENKRLAKAQVSSSYYDVINQLQDFQSGKEAKTLVGSTSLSVTFNAVIQNKNLHLFRREAQMGADGKLTFTDVRDYIPVIDEYTGEELQLTNLSGNGISYYTEKDGALLTEADKRTKHDNHTTVQSAAVDNAKDRSLDNLNLTVNTYRAAAAFIQLETEDGRAVNLKYITRLMTQPIIKEFDRRMKVGNDSLSEEFTTDLREKIYTDLTLDLIQTLPGTEPPKDVENVRFNPQLLLSAQSMKPGTHEYVTHQLAALNLFKKLDEIGKRLGELKGLFNQDTNGPGPNILSSLDKASRLQQIDQEPIANAREIFSSGENLTEQGITFRSTISVANNVLTQVLPYDRFTETFNDILKKSGRPGLTIDQQRNIIRSIRSFTYTEGQHWWQDVQTERVRLLYGRQGELSLGKRIQEAKYSWGKDNYFLQRLDPRIGDTADSPDYVEYQAVSSGRIDEDQNNRGWLDILLSEDPERKQLGEDLIRYAYITGGVQDANSFVKFVPVSYIAGTDFGQMLKDKVESMTMEGDEYQFVSPGFIEQYFQHNPEFAAQISKDTLSEITRAFTGTESSMDYPEVFAIPSREDPLYQRLGLEKYQDADGQPLPYISYRSKAENRWIFYRQLMVEGSIVYTRIDTLGNQYTDEYNGNVDSGQRSIFTENRALAAQVPASDAIQDIQNLKNNSMANYYRGNSQYEKINLKEGGKKAIKNALKGIIGNSEVPEALRTVAKIYHGIDSNEALDSALGVLSVFRYDPKIAFDRSMDFAGQANFIGTITINPSRAANVSEAAETFLHELTHLRLQSIIAASGYDQRVINYMKVSGLEESYNKKIEGFASKHPEVIKSIESLSRIRYEAYNVLVNQIGEDTIEQIKRDLVENSTISTLNHELVYVLGDLQEFVAGVLTNPNVMQYLNDIVNTKGNSFIERIWNALTELIVSIAKSFGIKVKDDSLLKEALAHVLKLSTSSISKNIDITNALVNGTELKVSTEKDASLIQKIIKLIYNKQINTAGNGLGYTIQVISNSALVRENKEVRSQTDKLLGKLRTQLKEVSKEISKSTTIEQRVSATIRYNQLREDINELNRNRDLDLVAAIGHRQLKWVDSILTMDNPTATDVHAAIDVANMWSSLIDLLYGDLEQIASTNPAFADLQTEAQQKRIQLINSKAKQVTINALKDRIELKPEDFNKDLEEIGIMEANFLTLSRAKSKLAQGIAILGRRAANNKTEEIKRVVDKLEALHKRMKTVGVDPNSFIQDGNWALVQRLSGNWYQYTSKLKSDRDNTIEALNRTVGLSDKALAQKKAEVWTKYWNEIRSSAIFVDSRVFFDFKDGTRKQGPEVDAAFAKLATEVNSEIYAKELLDKAHQLFNSYIQERESAKAYFQQTVALTEDEKAGKTIEDQEKLLDEKQIQQLEQWLQYNSPNEFLNRLEGSKSKIQYHNGGDRWLVMAPKSSKTEFYDSKYQTIISNEKFNAIYQDFKEIIEEMVSYLPITEQAKLNPDFLPIVSTDTILNLSGIVEKFRNFDATLMNAFTATEEEKFARVRPDEIPVLYTRMSNKLQEDPTKQSRDIIRVAEVFSMMALHYKHMAPVLDEILVAESLIKEVNRQRAAGESDGKILRNLQDSISYFKDAVIYKKPKLLQGKVDNPIYSMNPATQIKSQMEVKRLSQRKEELTKQIFDAWGEGVADTEELDAELEAVDKELDSYAKKAQQIYGSKATDTLMSINQMKALSYNPFSAVSNFTFGLVSVFIHGSGKMDYDNTSTRKAMGIMLNATQRYFSFGTLDNPVAHKILALMDRTDIMGHVTDTQYGESNLPSHKNSSIRNALAPFNWQKSGDYFTKGTMMIAMMLKKEVEVIEKATGEKKTIPLWEAFNNEGKWDDSKYEANPEWYSEDVNQQTAWNNYRDQMRKAGILVFGNQDRNAPLLARKNWLTRLVGQFRMSWFPEGIATRFMSERHDAELGRMVKGRWRTYGTLGVFTTFSVLAKQTLAALPGTKVDPFDGVTDKKGDPISEVDIENMRKNFAGMAWTVAFSAAIVMMRSFYEDDKKKGKKKLAAAMRRQLLLNMLIRNYQDLTLYSSPDVFQTVSGNLIPAATVITDSWKAMKATGHYLFGDTEDEKDAFDKWATKVSKAIPIVNLYPKTKFMLKRDVDAISR